MIFLSPHINATETNENQNPRPIKNPASVNSITSIKKPIAYYLGCILTHLASTPRAVVENAISMLSRNFEHCEYSIKGPICNGAVHTPAVNATIRSHIATAPLPLGRLYILRLVRLYVRQPGTFRMARLENSG
jgi:hypothetical protein